MGDSVTPGFGRGLAFATGFPVAPSSSVTFFVNSVHDSNPRSFSVSKQRFDQDFNTVTFLMKTDRCIQDRADLRVSENPPSRTGCFFHIEAMYALDTDSSFQFGPSSSPSVTKNCPFSKIFEPASQHNLGNSGLQVVARIFIHTLAAGFPATLRRCDDQQRNF